MTSFRSMLQRSLGVTATTVALIVTAAPAMSASPTQGSAGSSSAAANPCYPGLDFGGTNIAIRSARSVTNSQVIGRGNDGDCWTQVFQITGERHLCTRTGTYFDQWSYGANRRTRVNGYVSWCWLTVEGPVTAAGGK
ncbi:hypothetical protein GCM10010171_19670 [Actinokineospora fastidiosa]|uniref:Uncharacterized protein n=1 Tax=Actinokineospora fastidiosa TaxID=1816 RepID=A0A918GAZ5_9PSEU|nr:hypothetical protein GCM10010171_19670 [Actinokineospora fastidiosa]